MPSIKFFRDVLRSRTFRTVGGGMRGVAGVLFGVMLVFGFSRPHAKPPPPRSVQGFGLTCFSSDAERQCLTAAPSAPVHRG